MAEPTDGVHAMPVNVGWDSLPWFILEQDLFRLQKRIYRASIRGDASHDEVWMTTTKQRRSRMRGNSHVRF